MARSPCPFKGFFPPHDQGRGLKYGPGGSIVPGESDLSGTWKIMTEPVEAGDVSPPETVYGLIRVSYGEDMAFSDTDEGLQELNLDGVGVLVLIHKDPWKLPGEGPCDFRALL